MLPDVLISDIYPAHRPLWERVLNRQRQARFRLRQAARVGYTIPKRRECIAYGCSREVRKDGARYCYQHRPRPGR